MWSNGMEKKKIASPYNDEKLLNPKAYGGTDSAGRAKESKEVDRLIDPIDILWEDC